eukprot:NODE_590_length_5625_cov_0.852515.p3 type:complete len:308 gc:universal NODE_590_length_5625_cov_0.852515:4842-3919(-)
MELSISQSCWKMVLMFCYTCILVVIWALATVLLIYLGNNDASFYFHHAFVDFLLSLYQYVHDIWTAQRFTPWWKNAPLPIFNTKIIDVLLMKNRCVKYEGTFPSAKMMPKMQSHRVYKRDDNETGDITNVTVGNSTSEVIDLPIAPMPTVDVEESEAEATSTESFEDIEEIEEIEVEQLHEKVKVEVFEGLHDIYSISNITADDKWNYSVSYIGNYFGNDSFVAVNNNITDKDYKKLGMNPEHARYMEGQLNYIKMYVGNMTQQPVFDVKKNKSVIPKLQQLSTETTENTGSALSTIIWYALILQFY